MRKRAPVHIPLHGVRSSTHCVTKPLEGLAGGLCQTTFLTGKPSEFITSVGRIAAHGPRSRRVCNPSTESANEAHRNADGQGRGPRLSVHDGLTVALGLTLSINKDGLNRNDAPPLAERIYTHKARTLGPELLKSLNARDMADTKSRYELRRLPNSSSVANFSSTVCFVGVRFWNP